MISWTVCHLRRQGCDVHLIDCRSTDDTARLAAACGATVEDYDAPPVSWRDLLQLVERRAADSSHDWCMLCDADELRYSDWWATGETLTEGFARIQECGCTAADHQLLTFHPTDNGFAPGADPEQYFQHFSRDRWIERIGQVKAWRNTGAVRLAASAGHRAFTDGKQLVYHSFLSKHYPIRSQAHGERKVFQERNWLDPQQGRKDWHVQYRGLKPGTNFLRDPATLERWPE